MKLRLRNICLLGLLLLSANFVLSQAQGEYAQSKSASAGATNTPPQNTNPPSIPGELSAAPAGAAERADPVIGPGDLLKVSVMGAPDYDQEVRVGGNGSISLALVGAVPVASLSPEQAGELIRKRLMDGGFFSDPQVTVFEKEYATQGVSVLGEVQRPGVYPIIGPRRLFDAISLAGGTTPKAGQSVSITHRNQPNKAETVTLSTDPEKNLAANVQVFPGDTVVVAKAGIVYVVGDVHLSTGVVMDNGGSITVLQALAMAGGVNGTAAMNKTKVIRRTPEGQKEIPVELKKILAAKSPDIRLQAEDILFVPNSAAKNAAARSLDAAVHLATQVVAYHAVY